MRVGVPKEIKNHEYRVGLTPASVVLGATEAAATSTPPNVSTGSPAAMSPRA